MIRSDAITASGNWLLEIALIHTLLTYLFLFLFYNFFI